MAAPRRPIQAADENGSLQVESPASDPNVTGVGGTTLKLDTNNNESSEIVWNNDVPAAPPEAERALYFTRPSLAETATGRGGMRAAGAGICVLRGPNYGATLSICGEAFDSDRRHELVLARPARPFAR